jgi:exfoliative toxin A/B
MSFVRRIPVPMSALGLALASLGNLLLPYSPAIRAVCGALAAVVALLVALRLVADFPAVRDDLRSPATLAVTPAFFMALMVLATYLKPIAAAPAKGLWLAALALQLVLATTFVVRFGARFKLASVVPAWFLVFVGFVVASVTSPAFDMQPLGRGLLYAGLLGYAVALPLVIARVVRHKLPTPALPTIAIFAAPPSLCLVGYLAVTPVKQAVVVYALLTVAAVSLLYVLASLPRILDVPFCPTYAALTFPVVITAIALKQSNLFLAKTPAGALVPKAAVMGMDAVAAAVVLYVLVRYAAYLIAPAPQPEAVPAAVTP